GNRRSRSQAVCRVPRPAAVPAGHSVTTLRLAEAGIPGRLCEPARRDCRLPDRRSSLGSCQHPKEAHPMMTRSTFLQALLWELRVRGRAPVRTALETFVTQRWPEVEASGFDVLRWARE